MTYARHRFRAGFTAAAFALLLVSGTTSATADEGSPTAPQEAHSDHAGDHAEAPAGFAGEPAPRPPRTGDQDATPHPSVGKPEPENGSDRGQLQGGHQEAEDHSGHEGAESGGHEAHGEAPETSPDRPRAAVLGTFAAVNGGVLVTAFCMRRRTQGELQRRKAARAAALSQN